MSQSQSNPSRTTLSCPQRFEYFIREAVSNAEIWILTDDQGCVMLNTEDEECVPVWPDMTTAQAWAVGAWQDCKAQAIALKTWQLRWSDGLEEDQLFVVVFPLEEQEGTVIHPHDLDAELRKQIKKHNKAK